jgi:16S rRNA (guanine966-N2)-methyltransferase
MNKLRPARPARPGEAARAGGSGQVRIIGGRWRGTRLRVPPLPGLRPTPDRVRETLFNWLQPALPGARVLDLFAGSGALGLEAVSRGAASALLVERDPQACEALHEAVARLSAGDAVTVMRGDVLSVLEAPLHGDFDIVFADPPFDAGAWPAVLGRLPAWLAGDAWLYLESPASHAPQMPAGWHLHREGTTRGTRHALYRRLSGRADTLATVSEDDPTTTG